MHLFIPPLFLLGSLAIVTIIIAGISFFAALIFFIIRINRLKAPKQSRIFLELLYSFLIFALLTVCQFYIAYLALQNA